MKPFHFYGGFGLVNRDGLKKSSYYVYTLLNKLSPNIIDQGEDYIITKDGEDVQILAFNYVYFDQLFLKGDTSALKEESRHEIYEEKPSKELHFIIHGLDGKYKLTRYTLNSISRPKFVVKKIEIRGDHKEKMNLLVHGIELIIIKRLILKIKKFQQIARKHYDYSKIYIGGIAC